MRKTPLLLFLILTLACNVEPNQNDSNEPYFNLENQLNKEIDYLLSQRAGLWKTLISDEKEEQIQMDIKSSEEWRSQLSLFFDANIDKPGFQGSFYQESLSTLDGLNKTIYSAKSSKIPVQIFECIYSNEKLTEINIQWREKNLVFETSKKLRLFLDPESSHLIGFDVEGNEDMNLKENMFYNVHAVITY